MKIGFMYESQSELEKHIPITLIAETFANYPKQFEDLEYDLQRELEATGIDVYDFNRRDVQIEDFPFTTKIRLKKLGYTQSAFDEVQQYIRKAKEWALETGLPEKYVMTAEEQSKWKLLTAITQVIISR